MFCLKPLLIRDNEFGGKIDHNYKERFLIHIKEVRNRFQNKLNRIIDLNQHVVIFCYFQQKTLAFNTLQIVFEEGG